MVGETHFDDMVAEAVEAEGAETLEAEGAHALTLSHWSHATNGKNGQIG